MLKLTVIVIFILTIFACHSSNYDPGKGCEDRGGVQMCYRDIGTTHGHLMCKDGTTISQECY